MWENKAVQGLTGCHYAINSWSTQENYHGVILGDKVNFSNQIKRQKEKEFRRGVYKMPL